MKFRSKVCFSAPQIHRHHNYLLVFSITFFCDSSSSTAMKLMLRVKIRARTTAKQTQSSTCRKYVKHQTNFPSQIHAHDLLCFHFQALLDGLNSSQTDEKTTQIKSVNLVLQFLFFELRSSNQVRKWFMRKLSMELDELLTKTTIGKFFSKLSVRKSEENENRLHDSKSLLTLSYFLLLLSRPKYKH